MVSNAFNDLDNAEPIGAQLGGSIYDPSIYAHMSAGGSSYSASIKVDGDTELSNLEHITSGIGTKKDPYIVSGQSFDGYGYEYCIMIKNTDLYLVIQDCLITGAYGYGIYLENVTNIIIRDNQIEENGHGVFSIRCTSMTIINNYILENWNPHDSANGICLRYCDGVIIVNNTIMKNDENGIYILSSSNNFIASNRCHLSPKGIYLNSNSLYNTVVYNNCTLNDGEIVIAYPPEGQTNYVANNTGDVRYYMYSPGSDSQDVSAYYP